MNFAAQGGVQRADDVLLVRQLAQTIKQASGARPGDNTSALAATESALAHLPGVAARRGGGGDVAMPAWGPGALRCVLRAEDAAILARNRQHAGAITGFVQAARELVGPAPPLPSEEFINAKYREWEGQGDVGPAVELIGCFNGIAQSYYALGNRVEALKWLQEVEMVYENTRKVMRKNDLPWIDLHINVEEHFLGRLIMHDLYSKIFAELANTGAAAYHANQRLIWASAALRGQEPRAVQDVRQARDAIRKCQLRHPEPSFVDQIRVEEPELQLRGAWVQLRPRGPGPLSRLAFGSFIWNSTLYVCAGQTQKMLFPHDLWALPLEPVGTWRKLPDHPEGRPMLHQRLAVWENTAYLFHGHAMHIWTFDLVAEKWAKKPTKWAGARAAWPYAGDRCDECALHVLDGVLYAFGGEDAQADLGTSVLVALDLATMEWSHLGGTGRAVPALTSPDLRRHPTSWVVPAERRLYVLYGHACRAAAKMHGKPHGSDDDFQYADFWSYDPAARAWRQERRDGNFPAPRTEAAAAWNGTVGLAAVYGGYNATLPSPPGGPTTEYATLRRGDMFNFTYFGDTFVWSPETRAWRQVLTRGFPSYRAQASLLVDDATGKTYLFGGCYTNAQFVPSKHALSRTFGDVWQLLLDVPGGRLADADLRADADAPRMGPWKRCFTCGAVGREFRKCGGACGGAVLFCSGECLKDGWAEHKKAHGCRKT